MLSKLSLILSLALLPVSALAHPAAQERPPAEVPGDEKANHNTARSNKSTIAAPDGPAVGTGDATANHNTARSSRNKGGRRPAPTSGGTPAPSGVQDSASKPE